jgi:transposase InsO family protein
VRATAPDALWHIDTTVIRLLDGTRCYLHAVIDNFSRRILAWRLADHFDTANALAVLLEAGRAVHTTEPPVLLADGGVENHNARVDALVETGLLRRILSATTIGVSNSLIEAWWRQVKHGWLYLHELDTVAKVRRLVGFYVEEHNRRIPHCAFRGQTPDEVYFGTGDAVPDRLAERRRLARERRLAHNRAQACAVCA